MYEELVKRLRRMLDWELCDYDHNFKFADETIAEAADAIEELSREYESIAESLTESVKRVRKLQSPRWIPVTQRLPKEE